MKPLSQNAILEEGYLLGFGGVRLFYRKLGSRNERPPAILLHGGPGSNMNAIWPDLEPLAENHSILMYDQRGGGRSELVSEPSLLTAEHHVRDLEAVRLHFGMEKMTVMGHSWGAGLAVLYAADYPVYVDRMLLLGPMPPTKAFLDRRFDDAGKGPGFHYLLSQVRRSMPTTSDPVALCEQFFSTYLAPYFVEPTAMALRRGSACDAPPEAVRNWLVVSDATFASLGDWDFLPMLSQLQVETLIIEGAGSYQTLDGARAWADAMPNARLLLIPGSGHFPQVEQPALFFPAVDNFLCGNGA